MTHKRRGAIRGYAFILPWLIGFLLFTAYQVGYSIWLSFSEVTLPPTGIETQFIGLENYRQALFVNLTFTQNVINFLQDLIFNVPTIIVFSLVIALLLNLKLKGKGFFRIIFFLPVVIMSGPLINELISQNAFETVNFHDYNIVWMLQNSLPEFIWGLVDRLISGIIFVLWQTGVQVVIFLAALQKIGIQVYEAAKIDGASAWETFWKITLPTITPMIFVNIVYTIVTLSVFEINEIVIQISETMLGGSNGFGVASAMAWIYFLVIAIILGIVALMFLRKPKPERRAR